MMQQQKDFNSISLLELSQAKGFFITKAEAILGYEGVPSLFERVDTAIRDFTKN